jgi:hypothetical protein
MSWWLFLLQLYLAQFSPFFPLTPRSRGKDDPDPDPGPGALGLRLRNPLWAQYGPAPFGVFPYPSGYFFGGEIAGTPGFGVAAPGTLVGQSYSAFMGTLGFGITSPFAMSGAQGFGIPVAAPPPGGGKKPQAPQQQPSTGDQVEKPGEKKCGADVTRWLEAEIETYCDWMLWVKTMIEDVWGGQRVLPIAATLQLKYDFLEIIGSQLLHGSINFHTERCPKPTAECARTVTLAGRCVHQSELGNVMAGAVMRCFGIPWLLALEAAEMANRKVGSPWKLADEAGVEFGWDYVNYELLPKRGRAAGLKDFARYDAVARSIHPANPKPHTLSQMRVMMEEVPQTCNPCDDSVRWDAGHPTVNLPFWQGARGRGNLPVVHPGRQRKDLKIRQPAEADESGAVWDPK